MLQSTATERLSNKEGSRGDTWISPERGNRRDLLSGLGVYGDANLNQVGGLVEGKSTDKDDWKGPVSRSGRNLMLGKLPQIYKDDPS